MQVIISSHSPALINGLPNSAIKLFKTNEKGKFYIEENVHYQEAFSNLEVNGDLEVTTELSKIVLALPMHPYLTIEDMDKVISGIKDYCISRG